MELIPDGISGKNQTIIFEGVTGNFLNFPNENIGGTSERIS